MADFLETTYSDLKMNQIMLWPKKWQAIAWTNGHLDYRRIYASPGFSELIHSGLVTIYVSELDNQWHILLKKLTQV